MGLVIQGNEIYLTGMVGGSPDGGNDWWGEPDGFSSAHVIEALNMIGRENSVVIHLNSPGGYAHEGTAINALLEAHKGAVDMRLEGVCCSAATIIACGGDTVQIAPGTVYMIHDPATVTEGDAAEHQRSIAYLNASSDAYASIYTDKSGMSVEDVRALMVAETWYTPEQCVEAGFADGILGAEDLPSEEIVPAAFAYSRFARAPERLVALAKAKGWTRSVAMVTAVVPAEAKVEPTEEPEPEPTPPVPAAQPVPEPEPPADAVAIAATCGAFGMVANQITAFIKGGGTLERAQARATEMGEIREVLAAAARANPAVSLTTADAVARNLTIEQVRAEVAPQVAAQVAIDPQTPPVGVPEDPKSRMVAAIERINAMMRKNRGG